jgi:hypothetical protein
MLDSPSGPASADSTVPDDGHRSPAPQHAIEHALPPPVPHQDEGAVFSASSDVGDNSDATSGQPEGDLYDPRADDVDERWVQRNLARGQKARGPHLTCPSCFTLLCVQSQAHEEYSGQFRAVFVQNCAVDDNSAMRVRIEEHGNRKEPNQRTERYRPVSCARCSTEVAVLDEDDVYHFCNVLS